MRTLLRHVLLAVSVLATASAAAADDDDNLKYSAWTNKGLPPVPRDRPIQAPDEDLEFIVENGFGGWVYTSCRSEAFGQRPIEPKDGSLPIGNGRALVCPTREQPITLVREVLSQDGERYCWKGQATEYRVVSDARLDVTVTKTSLVGPWTLRATSPTAWTVKMVQSNFGSIWPLWLDIRYKTVALAPARNGSCDAVLR